MGEKELHTAEHIFARALQNLGVELHVLKVDTENGPVGRAIFKERIESKTLSKAELAANRTLSKGLEVNVEFFNTLSDAKGKFPKVRVYEERLESKDSLRLVKIGDYDFAMCKRQHVDNVLQIKAFALKSVSYPEGRTRIEFVVGEEAIDYLLNMNAGAIEQGIARNFNPGEIAAKYAQAEKRNKDLEGELKDLFYAMLNAGQRLFYYGDLDVGNFYKFAKRYVESNEGEYAILLNKNQITCVCGNKCEFDLGGLAKALKDSSLFEGVVKERTMNGRITEGDNVYGVVKEFIESSRQDNKEHRKKREQKRGGRP